MSRNSSGRFARWLVHLASRLVPRAHRNEWRQEWLAELAALEGPERGSDAGATRLPGAVAFALGAFPHALWTATEGWTMESVVQDIRYAARVLRRAPGFTAVAALTLALGIGANASIFSLVNGLLFRAPAEIRQPERLVQIARSYEDAPRWDSWSWPAVQTIRGEAAALSGVAGYWDEPFVLGRGTEAEAVFGQAVTGHFFDVLGVTPRLGRLFQPMDDGEPVNGRFVVLSHGLWMRRFGGDPGVIGRTVTLGSLPYVVVGVTPPGFSGQESIGTPPQLWVLGMHHPESAAGLRVNDWGNSWINAIGRLRDGVTFEHAEASMALVSARLREGSPINEGMLALIAPGVGLDPESRQAVGRISLILMTLAGLVLLLTCANVATLWLARAAARRTEVGVRMTLGAGRGRVIRQLVTEGLLVAVLATAVAVPLVLLFEDALPFIVPSPVSVSLDADGRVMAFLALLGIATGVIFSAAPAWSSSRSDLTDGLRERAVAGGRMSTRLRDALVVSQLAMSLGLVAGAGLLGRSVLNAHTARPGFDPSGVQIGFLNLQPTGRYDAISGTELYRRILERAEAIPGVTSATWASQTPLVGGHSRSTVRPLDQPENQGYEAESHRVGPRYFETLGIPLLRGRHLGGFDDEPETVVVINEALARMFWPEQDPLGKEIQGQGGIWRVVGLVADVQMRSLRDPGRPGVYYPLAQTYAPSGVLHVKTGGPPVSAEALRRAVAEVDPELPVTGIQNLQDGMTASVGETRTIAYLMGSFATLALVLASIGLYGLVSYGVSQRIREMGVRIALGAQPASLVGLVVQRGIRISLMGIVLGLGLSLVLGRALRSLLFGIAPADRTVLAAAALLLLLIASVAAWLPARRASRVDAAVSLRG